MSNQELMYGNEVIRLRKRVEELENAGVQAKHTQEELLTPKEIKALRDRIAELELAYKVSNDTLKDFLDKAKKRITELEAELEKLRPKNKVYTWRYEPDPSTTYIGRGEIDIRLPEPPEVS